VRIVNTTEELVDMTIKLDRSKYDRIWELFVEDLCNSTTLGEVLIATVVISALLCPSELFS